MLICPKDTALWSFYSCNIGIIMIMICRFLLMGVWIIPPCLALHRLFDSAFLENVVQLTKIENSFFNGYWWPFICNHGQALSFPGHECEEAVGVYIPLLILTTDQQTSFITPDTICMQTYKFYVVHLIFPPPPLNDIAASLFPRLKHSTG